MRLRKWLLQNGNYESSWVNCEEIKGKVYWEIKSDLMNLIYMVKKDESENEGRGKNDVCYY